MGRASRAGRPPKEPDFNEEATRKAIEKLHKGGYYETLKKVAYLRETPYVRRPWTPVEDDLITSNLVTDFELSLLLGRSQHAIVNRRARLKGGDW